MTFEVKWPHHKAKLLYNHKSLLLKNVATKRVMWANHQKNTYKLHVPLFPYSKNDIYVELLSFFVYNDDFFAAKSEFVDEDFFSIYANNPMLKVVLWRINK
jgi:hypothetical protein